MKERALQLLDACLEAYDNWHVSKDVTGDGKAETFCNFSVDHVLARMGYVKMRNPDGKPMMANQMIDFLTRKVDDWQKIEMGAAQDLANDGRVIIAGISEEPHGHVVVVRPGLEDLSGKWGVKVPKVSHVGARSYIGRGVNHAFKEIPMFWMLKEAS